MKTVKKFILMLVLLFIMLLAIYQIGKRSILDQDKINFDDKFSYLIPLEVKSFLKNTIFAIPTKNRQIENQKRKIANYEDTLDFFLGGIKNYEFKKLEPTNVKSQNDDLYLLGKFDTSFVTSQNIAAKSTTYLDIFKKDIYLASSKGVISYFDIDKLEDSYFTSKVIPSNFTQLIQDKNIYMGVSGYGIKDLSISQNKIFLSFSNQVSPNCYNTGIIAADLNKEYLNFRKIFSPNECIMNNNGEFYPFSAGGRIVEFDENNILFSHGEYLMRDLAQNKDSIFGKIIKINNQSQEYEIISMGHRNPQGLKYDQLNNLIYISEHGPTGGDEVNIINDLQNNETPNFGWPQATYGKIANYDKVIFENHKDYGFIEPSTYFTPSIGISELVFSNKNDSETDLFVSSLGYDLEENDLSIHHFVYNRVNNELKNFDIINIGERIRDMQLLDDGRILMYLETTGSLGILSKK